MGIFENAVREVSGVSPVIRGREKISTAKLLEWGKVTVDEFDLIRGRNGEYAVFHVAGTNFYFNAGKIGTEIAQKWEEAFGGDLDKANDELIKSGGVTLKAYQKKTQSGNLLTVFDECDD